MRKKNLLEQMISDEVGEKMTQVNARMTIGEKLVLMDMAKQKGVNGITALLQLLAKARKVDILV
jgi:hypothetical protein